MPISLSASTTTWLAENGYTLEKPQAIDEHGNNALAKAILRDNQTVIEELLSLGIYDLNQRNHDGNNCLWFACFRNNLPLIDKLINAGVNIDNQNAVGATCLMYAASASKTAVVKQLLTHNVDIHLRSQDDYTALDVAGNLDILKLLKPLFVKA